MLPFGFKYPKGTWEVFRNERFITRRECKLPIGFFLSRIVKLVPNRLGVTSGILFKDFIVQSERRSLRQLDNRFGSDVGFDFVLQV